jgi:FK506-binding nuclear protein
VLRSEVVVPDTKVLVCPPADVRLTNVALGEDIKDTSRAVVKLSYMKAEIEDEETTAATLTTTFIAALTPSKVCFLPP